MYRDWALRYCLGVWIYAADVRGTGDLLYEMCHVAQRMEVTAALMGEHYKYGYG